MKLKIALGQMDIAFGDPETNLQTVRRLAEESAVQGADLLLLPELWSTGYDLKNAGKHAAGFSEDVFWETALLAKQYHVAIAGSCLSHLEGGGVGNTLVVFAANGALLGAYSKMHLFRLMDEHSHLSPGDQPAILDAPWGKTGLAICYDLRFPELFRHYAAGGVQLALLPAEWPRPRLGHWQTLLRARAIENQMFVAACNRVGSDPGNLFGGHSCVIGPWGDCLVETGEEEELAVAEIDLEEVDQVRARYPFLQDRRLF